MADAAHVFGADLQVSPSGDLALSTAETLTRERLLRRLLTNPGDALFAPEYGAGLARFVGSPAPPARIRAVVRGQIFREATVARSPEPAITVQAGPDGVSTLSIRYASADGATRTLTLPLNPPLGETTP